MQLLYLHQSFPAQFGAVASHLARTMGWKCYFASQAAPGEILGIERIQYELAGGATTRTHFCSRTIENTIWHSDAIYNALKDRPEIKPDLIIAHSGFSSAALLRELYPTTPVVNLFEFYYRPREPESDMDFRRDLGWELSAQTYLRSRCRNATALLDLQNCQVGYCPTEFQRSRFPAEYQYKLRTAFDGIDRSIFHSHGDALRPPLGQRPPRTVAGVEVPAEARIVTYVSRGFESMRGFDIFMRSARLIARQHPDVIFIVVGSEKMPYGSDEQYLGEHQTFKDWVLAQDEYDLSRFHFIGRLPPVELGKLLAATDLHIYLTAPFILSWSMMDALSCGAVVLGSSTAPVKEMIRDGENGLLADFFNPEEFARKALQVLADPAEFRPLGKVAEEMIAARFSIEKVIPQMLSIYEEALHRPPKLPAPHPVLSLPGIAQAGTAVPFAPIHASIDPVAPPAMAADLVSNETMVTAVRPRTRSPFRG
ncbi:MAG TPA: glycosyltransferase [Tepidisphaeraceae bacterium]|nr:glycosyltransferase [Tepidisphaeraceae bacterium]